MTTKAQILILAVFGNLGLATIFLLLNLNQLADQEKAYLEDAALVYQQAWHAAADNVFANSVGLWHPTKGAPAKAAIWSETADASLFPASSGSEVKGNPLLNAIANKDQAALAVVLEGLFDKPLSEGVLSFVSFAALDNDLTYCKSETDQLAVDTCEAVAMSENSLSMEAQPQLAVSGQGVAVVARADLLTMAFDNRAEHSSAFHIMYFDFLVAGQPLGTLALGKNLRSVMGFFEAEFEVNLAIVQDSVLITTDQRLDTEPGSGLANGSDISQQIFSVISSRQQLPENQQIFGFTDHSLDDSIVCFSDHSFDDSVFGFPVNKTPTGKRAWFVVVREQRAALQQGNEFIQSRLLTGISLFFVVLVAMVWLINYAFNGIDRAISVLQALTKGDDSVSIDGGSRWLRSEDDEIARLSEALEAYKAHLIEMDDIKLYQQYNRQQRDAIMMDKMRLLADQLEGEAKRLILSDVAKMQQIANSRPKEGSEDASVDLMSMAFSRMSQEVVTLLDARTDEMRQAYEQASNANQEIQSSINYAAKLQRALLRAESFPADINIHVTWQPRDIVGGDIYVVRTLGNKTIIAVIDCTGHGVPGAFTSVIARAVIDRAIEDKSITTAGAYLSKSNRLIKDMLFQHGAQASDSDAGFDGTVCILDRDTNRLEFAGANSSLLMLNKGEITELKGDRKSVGARRTRASYEFTTRWVDNPSGMFVMLTDGVTDVMNELPQPTAFGRRRLMRLIETTDTSDPETLSSHIMGAINGYRGDSALRDDLTLLAFYIHRLQQPNAQPGAQPESEPEPEAELDV
jgi:serine phosphatase RsbU (regulator of sigma subunit)